MRLQLGRILCGWEMYGWTDLGETMKNWATVHLLLANNGRPNAGIEAIGVA